MAETPKTSYESTSKVGNILADNRIDEKEALQLLEMINNKKRNNIQIEFSELEALAKYMGIKNFNSDEASEYMERFLEDQSETKQDIRNYLTYYLEDGEGFSEVSQSKFATAQYEWEMQEKELKYFQEALDFFNEKITQKKYHLQLKDEWGNIFIYNQKHKLNIPLSKKNIHEVWIALVDILNAEGELSISGKKDFRHIYKKVWWKFFAHETVYYNGTKFEGNHLDENKALKSNILSEELYKFTQNVKGIPIEDWNIEWYVDRLKKLQKEAKIKQ